MVLKQDFNLIITIVHRGFSDPVINIAKSAGAEGATILTGRGTSIHETDVVLGVQIQPEKEIILILVKKNLRRKIMKAITTHAGLSSEGRGLCFSIPVDEVAGISHLMQTLAPNKKINHSKKTILPPSVKAVQAVEKSQEENKPKGTFKLKKKKSTRTKSSPKN